MKKHISILVIALVLVGCSATTGKNTVSNERINEEIILVENVNSNLDSAALNRMDVASAFKTANSYYQNGDFTNAITAYDFVCAKFQYIPACIRLGNMFERGEGVSANKMVALDIYQRACYSGHTKSCSDVKRLQ